MRKLTKYCLKKLVCGLLSAALVTVSVPTCFTGLGVNAETAGNYIKNGDFESLDNDTSPDYSPNEWEFVSGGWYIEKVGTAVEGNAYLVATQDSESKQTVSLPNGSYDFSGWLNPSYNVNEIKITLKSGANEASVSVKNGETAAYKTIDRFEVTTGEITITLTADVVTNFDAAAILDDLKLVKSSDNFIKNPSFENTDNGTVPDYSPNEWNTISGWYVNSDPSAIDGNHVLIATQDAETSQTISLPDGEYHFSGWLFPLDAAQAEMSITLTSGSNTQMITAKSGDGAGYQTIENFVVTGGTITITLKSTFGVQFGSPAMVDDLKLVDSSTIPVPQVTVTFDANGGTGTMTEQKIDEGKPTALKTNTYKKAKYNFTGWNTQADGTGTAYTNGQTVTLSDDLTLYAQWQEAVIPGPETNTFTPDDLTTNADKRTTYEDNELNWYTDEIIWNGSTVLDGSRVFDFVENPTDEWQKTENHFVRTDTDDLYAVSLMFKINHPLADRDYDIIYKDLQVPVKGGKLSYYIWFRNGLPINHDVFSTAAVVYDKEGNAYNLGISDPLGWSGDHVNTAAGWVHYEGIMPKDVEIVKIGIMLTKTNEDSPAVLGPSFKDEEGKYGAAGADFWPGEDWTPVDEITIEDTILCDDDIVFDDELKWNSDNATISELGEYLNPWCMYDDKTIELDCAFNALGVEDTNIIYRDLEEGVKGGTFGFKLFNCTNSNLAGEAQYRVSVIGYDVDGSRVDLGDCTTSVDGTDFLKFSGLPQTAYVFNGYNNCSVQLPADRTIERLEIHIKEMTGASVVSALFMLDDVKFTGTEFVALDNGGNQDTDNETPVLPDEDNEKTGADAPFGTVLAVIVLSAAALILVQKKRTAIRR